MEGYGNENPGAFQSTRPLRGATSQPITKVELLGEFQPTRPLRGATCSSAQESLRQVFQPTRPLRGATRGRATAAPDLCYFNPRAPCGARRMGTFCELDAEIFQPTRPLRGATLNLIRDFRVLLFQPTRPLRGATANAAANDAEVKSISTHAPLAGRDFKQTTKMAWDKKFQPTRPLRGATCGHRISAGACRISTHAPLAGRDYSVNLIDRFPVISTHAPLAGRDGLGQTAFAPCRIFQPTRPLRGATASRQLLTRQRRYFNPRAPCGARQGGAANMARPISISTHAPLAGRDNNWRQNRHTHLYFNPRAPCGARQQKCTNHYAHFCDNRQISDAFAQNAACQGILLLFDAGKPCGFWVRTAQVISARLCFAL